jgi:hypothetical protein
MHTPLHDILHGAEQRGALGLQQQALAGAGLFCVCVCVCVCMLGGDIE